MTTIDYDEKENKLILYSSIIDDLRLHFSVANDAIQFQKTFNPYTPARTSVITPSNRAELGMLLVIQQYINDIHTGHEVVITPKLLAALYNPPFNVTNADVLSVQSTKTPRPYQVSAVVQSLISQRGVLQIGTGGGKTLTMYLLQQTFNKFVTNSTTLILLPAHLVHQTYTDFLEYGVKESDCVVWKGEDLGEIKPIIFASYNLLTTKITSFKHLSFKSKTKEINCALVQKHQLKEAERKKLWTKEKNRLIGIMNGIDLLLLDEVHSLRRDNQLSTVIQKIKTKYRFGFTGTLPDTMLDRWNIFGRIGPVIVDITAHELINAGYLTNVKTEVIKIHYTDRVIANPSNTNRYHDELDFVHNNPFRCKVIKQIVSNLNKNVLILVDRLEYGKHLEQLLSSTGKTVYWVNGSVEDEDREKIRKEFEVNDNIICIAITRVFSTGISINNLHYIVFAQSGKAKISIIQSIGRGLRLHPLKNELVIFDLADILTYGSEHLLSRIEHYESEKIQYEISEIHQ